MKQFLASIFLALFFLGKSFACLNGESTSLKNGIFLYEDREGNVPYGHIFQNAGTLRENIKQLEGQYKSTKDLDYLSDKGLILILLKQYDEAVGIFLQIEKLKPNRYSTASNIGTAYELLGQNENALKWIKKAVEIDPASHKNSEWIHIKILEAKIRGERFYTTKFLLNTNFGDNDIPESGMDKQELQKLSTALYYQLNERISFVQPKEKIVAQLLFDLGNIAVLLGNYEDALADYGQATKYGFKGQLIEQRAKEVRILSNLSKQSYKSNSITNVRSYWIYGLIVLGISALAIFVVVLNRRNNKKRTSI